MDIHLTDSLVMSVLVFILKFERLIRLGLIRKKEKITWLATRYLAEGKSTCVVLSIADAVRILITL